MKFKDFLGAIGYAVMFFAVGIAVSALLFYSVHLLDYFIIKEPEAKPQPTCVVISTNITLIPATSNSITVLRKGKREVCYIYKSTDAN